MLRNRIITAFACAGLVGAVACAPAEEDVQFDDTSTFEEPATAAPITPTPMTEDTMTMPPMDDTTGLGVDSAIVDVDSVTM